MAWIYLMIAGVLEIIWALCLKRSEGFTRPPWGMIGIVTSIASFALLALALRHVPLGTGYAIWTGIGVAGTAIMGMALFKETASPLRILFVGMILLAIIGLHLTTD
ncbi:MAG: multidrug efflux SMR transporter [Pirellulales bacterium]